MRSDRPGDCGWIGSSPAPAAAGIGVHDAGAGDRRAEEVRLRARQVGVVLALSRYVAERVEAAERLGRAAADPELQPAATEQVGDGGLLRHVERVLVAHVDTAVPISMRLVRAPIAASRGNGDASWRAKWCTRTNAPSRPISSAATASSTVCASASRAVRVRDHSACCQWPKERKPMRFLGVDSAGAVMSAIEAESRCRRGLISLDPSRPPPLPPPPPPPLVL